MVSDCGALKMPSEPKNTTFSSADALNAGMDLNCGPVYDSGLAEAINVGLTTEAKLDASVERSFSLLMRAGYFDPLDMVPFSKITPDDVGTHASHTLAKEAALQGMVLLTNENNALPLRRGASVTTAVLGPLANITLGLMSRYYDAVCPGPLNASRGAWGAGGGEGTGTAALRKTLHADGRA